MHTMHVCVRVYMCVCVCMYVSVCGYVCLCLCICMCMCVCVCMCVSAPFLLTCCGDVGQMAQEGHRELNVTHSEEEQ